MSLFDDVASAVEARRDDVTRLSERALPTVKGVLPPSGVMVGIHPIFVFFGGNTFFCGTVALGLRPGCDCGPFNLL